MNTILSTAAAALLATTATAAFAGNVAPAPVDPIIPAPAVTDWSGFYFGATGGWMAGTTENPRQEIGFDGLVYGGFAGYNYQLDSGLVLGAELAATMGEMEWEDAEVFDATLIDLKARVGFAADRALVYGFGGYTIASYSDDAEGAGLNFGAGVDFLVTDKIFVGAEYIYRDIEDTVNDPAFWTDTSSTIQARVGLKF